MSDLGFDALAARILARRWRRPAAVPPTSEEERALAIQAMIGAVRWQRRRRYLAAGGLAAAAAIALAVGVGPRLRGGGGAPRPAAVADMPSPATPTPVRHGDERIWLHRGAEVAPGQRFVAQAGERLLLSSTAGSTLWLNHDSEVRVLDTGATQRFSLARGQVHAEVAPLRGGERFLIETADAEVEVHGTAFDVTVAPADARCRAGVVTRVAVTHGVVEVRSGGRDERVTAGQQWPVECPVGGAPVEAGARAPVEARRGGGGRAVAAAAAVPDAQARRSTLAAENDQLAAALASERRGEPEQALMELDDLLARWPISPLAETAMAERLRLLQAGGESRATARAARAYLRRFPNGSARDEALRLAGDADR